MAACYDIFLSYDEDKGKKQARVLSTELRNRGFQVWYENDDSVMTIQEKVVNSNVFLMILTEGVFRNYFALLQLEQALESKKPVLFVHEHKDLDAKFDFAPQCLKDVHHKWHRAISQLLLDVDSLKFEIAKPMFDKLEKRIRRVNYSEFTLSYKTCAPTYQIISKKAKKCQYRDWLFDEVTTWYKKPLWDRLLWIESSKGNGKTTFISAFANKHHFAFAENSANVRVIGSYFFEYNVFDTRDGRTCLFALAKQLSMYFGDAYRRELASLSYDLLNEEDLHVLFQKLIALPCSRMINNTRLVITIDSLNDCLQKEFENLVLEHFFNETPDWLGLIILCEPRNLFHTRRSTTISLDTEKNTKDLTEFLSTALKDHLDTTSDVDNAAKELASRSQGNFINASYYLHILSDLVALKKEEEGHLSLRDIHDEEIFPTGRDGVLKCYFYRLLKVGFRENEDLYHKIISVIATAREKLPRDILETILSLSGVRVSKLKTILRAAEGVICVSDKKVYLAHEVVRDWLLQTDNTLLGASVDTGNKFLAGWCFVARSGPYAYRHGIYHLAMTSSHKVPDLLFDSEWLSDAVYTYGIPVKSIIADTERWYCSLGITDGDHRDSDVVIRALEKSVHALNHQPEQLVSQLLSRITDSQHPLMNNLSASNDSYGKPWLKPVLANLESAHSPLRRVLRHPDKVKGVTIIGSNGVATAGEAGVRMWSFGGNIVWNDCTFTRATAITSNLVHVVAGSREGNLSVWKTQTGKRKELAVDLHHGKSINCIAIQDEYIVTAGGDGIVLILQCLPGRSLTIVDGLVGAFGKQQPYQRPKKQNPIRKSLRDSLNSMLGRRKKGKNGSKGEVKSVAVCDDHVVSGGQDQILYVWSLAKTTLLHSIYGIKRAITCISVDEGGIITSGSSDCVIRISSALDGSGLREIGSDVLEGHCLGIVGLDVYKNTIVTGGLDNDVIVWDEEQNPHTLDGHEHFVNDVAIFKDRIASVSDDQTLRIWSASASMGCKKAALNEALFAEAKAEKVAIFLERKNGIRVISLCQEEESVKQVIRVWEPTSERKGPRFIKTLMSSLSDNTEFSTYYKAFYDKGELRDNTYTKKVDHDTTLKLTLSGRFLDVKRFTKATGIWTGVIGYTCDSDIIDCDCSKDYIVLADSTEKLHMLRLIANDNTTIE